MRTWTRRVAAFPGSVEESGGLPTSAAGGRLNAILTRSIAFEQHVRIVESVFEPTDEEGSEDGGRSIRRCGGGPFARREKRARWMRRSRMMSSERETGEEEPMIGAVRRPMTSVCKGRRLDERPVDT